MGAPSEPVRVVARALAGSGIDLVASCGVDAWDARAPLGKRARDLFAAACGCVVVASAGPALWRAARAEWRGEHPLDDFVGRALDRVDAALGAARIAFRRFEPTLRAEVVIDFRALGEIVGLGSRGPFGMLIHEAHGPWWALRGAYLVDAEVDPPLPHSPPCAGCAAPCVHGIAPDVVDLARASAEARRRCVIGAASRYDDDQIAYHHGRATT